MSAEMDLHDIIYPAVKPWGGTGLVGASSLAAQQILAAGYSKPRTVTTSEELDALNEGAVVLDSDEWVLRKNRLSWRAVASSGLYSHDAVGLPATVLHEGAAA